MVAHGRMLHPYRSHSFVDQNSWRFQLRQSSLFSNLAVMMLVCLLRRHYLAFFLNGYVHFKSVDSYIHLIMAMDQPTFRCCSFSCDACFHLSDLVLKEQFTPNEHISFTHSHVPNLLTLVLFLPRNNNKNLSRKSHLNCMQKSSVNVLQNILCVCVPWQKEKSYWFEMI